MLPIFRTFFADKSKIEDICKFYARLCKVVCKGVRNMNL